MKCSIEDFFNKCDQIYRTLRIWSHLMKKSLMENFVSSAVHFDVKSIITVNKNANKYKVILLTETKMHLTLTLSMYFRVVSYIKEEESIVKG